MREYFDCVMVPFGETLTDMERRGIKVNAHDYLAGVEVRARADKEKCVKEFTEWVLSVAGPKARHFNPQSSSQIQTLLFGGAEHQKKKGEFLPKERVIKVPLTAEETAEFEAYEESLDAAREASAAASAAVAMGDFAHAGDGGAAVLSWATLGVQSAESLSSLKATELKDICRKAGLKLAGKKADLIERISDAVVASDRLPADDETVGGEAAAPEVEAVAAPEKMGGTKVNDHYSRMSTEDLCDALRARSLPADGLARAELERSLRYDDLYAHALLREYGNPSPVWLPPLAPPPAPAPAPAPAPSLAPALATDSAPSLARSAEAPRGPRGAEAVVAGGDFVSEPVHPLAAKYAGVTGRRGGKRYFEITINSLGMKPTKYTASGLPAVTMDVLKGLAGKSKMDGSGLDEENPGSAYNYFGGGESGLRACRAMDALCKMGSIDTMLSSFIAPLQVLADENSRVHCSLNFNTETGRLSSRKPNLQNQPALEKDQYKVSPLDES